MAAESPSTDPAIAWVRAALGLAVLTVLAEGDRHGYALAQRISEIGLGPIRGGALYPVLGRLESEGAVVSLWQAGEGGPGRKVYSMTDTGRARLAVERERWHEFSTAMEQLASGSTVPAGRNT